MKNLNKIFALIVLSAPLLAYADTEPLYQTGRLVTSAGNLVSNLVKLAIALALLVFFWGLVKFIFKIGGDEKAVAQGRPLMIWGLVALFVIISVWGLVRLLQTELGVTVSDTPIVIPFIPNP